MIDIILRTVNGFITQDPLSWHCTSNNLGNYWTTQDHMMKYFPILNITLMMSEMM